ncbi:MAG: hypothetical protein H8E40_02230 [Chloroflexi bacterium]|nr:hypothetical protein [Chloroflexota bacterium]
MADTSESSRTITVFKWKISITVILSFLVFLLFVTNLYSLIPINWYSERFRENVASTQNAFQNLLWEFDDILSDGSLDEKSIRELEVWVEKTSIQSATVTFLDKRHFDLWDSTSDALELFEDFLEEFRDTASIISDGNKTIELDQDSNEKLEKIHETLLDFYEHVFPVDVLEEGTKWQTPNYGEADKARGKLSRFEQDVARAWLILPVIRGSTLPPPEVQARELLVEAVGEEYVTEFFEFDGVQFNYWKPEDWLASVQYYYKIRVGDYTVSREVYIRFSKMNEYLSSTGVPVKDNLMPFNVTKEQAVEIALSNMEREFVETDAAIYCVKKLLNGTRIGRYLWCIDFYHNKKYSSSGSATRVIIDPITGQVIEAEMYGWESS